MRTLFRAIANGGPLDGEHQHVDEAAGAGKVLNVSDLFFRYTLDITTDFLLGADIKSLWYAAALLCLLLPPNSLPYLSSPSTPSSVSVSLSAATLTAPQQHAEE